MVELNLVVVNLAGLLVVFLTLLVSLKCLLVDCLNSNLAFPVIFTHEPMIFGALKGGHHHLESVVIRERQ